MSLIGGSLTDEDLKMLAKLLLNHFQYQITLCMNIIWKINNALMDNMRYLFGL
jgi:hypothetical protein